jgi:hypothetical protein
MLSHKIEREMEYSAKTTLPLNSIVLFTLCRYSIISPYWYSLSLIYLFAIGEKIQGLIFHSQVSVFGDSCLSVPWIRGTPYYGMKA